MNGLLFLCVRALHVLLAATWLGAVAMITFFVFPALEEAGPAGGAVGTGLMKRKLNTFMAVLAGLTVVTGLLLYWRFTGGFSPELSRTRGAMAFGTGGILGIVAAIIGGSVVGRSAKRMGELMTQAAGLPDGPGRASLLQKAGALRRRAATGGWIVVLLLVVAIVLMALGHYI